MRDLRLTSAWSLLRGGGEGVSLSVKSVKTCGGVLQRPLDRIISLAGKKKTGDLEGEPDKQVKGDKTMCRSVSRVSLTESGCFWEGRF